jgi:hypothetical protein
MIAIERLHAIGFVPVSVGERFKILPGTAHRISNESTSECQFLLVQGIGRYDWRRADLANNEKP